MVIYAVTFAHVQQSLYFYNVTSQYIQLQKNDSQTTTDSPTSI